MAGLVLEGGSFRTCFTLGALDALLENDLLFPYVIGVSAGACAATSYMSKQHHRGIDVFLKYRNEKAYESLGNFKNEGSIFGIKFIYETIPNELELFDYDAFKNYPGNLEVVVTDAKTGEAHYLNGKAYDYHNDQFKATCSLPGVFPGVILDGRRYFDGGIADSIPLLRSNKKGNEYNLVILTRPKGYRRSLDTKTKAVIKLMEKKYPNLSEALKNRPAMYNGQLDYLNKSIAKGKTIALYPSKAYKDTESDPSKMLEAYKDGYEAALLNLEVIKKIYHHQTI